MDSSKGSKGGRGKRQRELTGADAGPQAGSSSSAVLRTSGREDLWPLRTLWRLLRARAPLLHGAHANSTLVARVAEARGRHARGSLTPASSL